MTPEHALTERASWIFLSNRGQSDLERKADTQIGGTQKARDYLSGNHAGMIGSEAFQTLRKALTVRLRSPVPSQHIDLLP